MAGTKVNAVKIVVSSMLQQDGTGQEETGDAYMGMPRKETLHLFGRA